MNSVCKQLRQQNQEYEKQLQAAKNNLQKSELKVHNFEVLTEEKQSELASLRSRLEQSKLSNLGAITNSSSFEGICSNPLLMRDTANRGIFLIEKEKLKTHIRTLERRLGEERTTNKELSSNGDQVQQELSVTQNQLKKAEKEIPNALKLEIKKLCDELKRDNVYMRRQILQIQHLLIVGYKRIFGLSFEGVEKFVFSVTAAILERADKFGVTKKFDSVMNPPPLFMPKPPAEPEMNKVYNPWEVVEEVDGEIGSIMYPLKVAVQQRGLLDTFPVAKYLGLAAQSEMLLLSE
eukprot:Filipodium_phascolosomae@DN2689_c0_g1_i12.p1